MMEEDTSSLFISLELMVEVIHFCYNKMLQKKKKESKILVGKEGKYRLGSKKAACLLWAAWQALGLLTLSG